MLRTVSSIEDLGSRVSDFIDCYVSTDSPELEDVFLEQGFSLNRVHKAGARRTLVDQYEDQGHWTLGSSSLKDPKTGLEVDCVDVPLEEALRKREEIGFMPMSKFRVYTNGSPNSTRILIPIMKALDRERQNMAFTNDSGSATYVKLSEFYC